MIDAGEAARALALLAGARDTPALLAACGMAHLAAGQPSAALPKLRAAVAAGDASPVSRLNLALALSGTGQRAAARHALLALEADAPDWAEPPLRLAELLRAEGDLAGAACAYERALEGDPGRAEALLALGALRLGQGRAAAAQTLLLRCCAAAPLSWQAWDALGAALAATGDDAAAESALARAHSLAPARLAVARRLAEAACAAGHADAALAALDLETAADPANPVPLAARATLLARLGRLDEAADALEVAVALSPGDAGLAREAAEALLRADRHGAALPALRRAIDLAPDDAALRLNLAATLGRLHRHGAARRALEIALSAHGESVEVLCNLAGAQVCAGEQQAGVATARRAAALHPTSAIAWRTLTNALCYADDVPGAAILHAARQAGVHAPRGAVPAAAARRPRRGKIRVGLLSRLLRTHPVGWLTLAGLENLDPSTFDLVCLGPPDSADPMQRRFRAAAAEWHVLGDAPAAQARALDLDILIDLGGYGDFGLLGLCAERLAPIQVKWVGMQNHSIGLAEIDWFVSDRWETPPDLEHLYSERLLIMPDGYACYTPPPHAPDVAPAPAARLGYATFGCFNNYAKITPGLIATWSRMLHALPSARLILKTHQFDEPELAAHAQARFAMHGIDPDRVSLRGASPHRALLAEYADVDIVLDPHPYSGGLTTCEALWMGVPVLTRPGKSFASRHSTSHLCNVGLQDWVARDADDYVRLAIARAGDPEGLTRLRRDLRSRMRASPLCDGPRFGRNLGDALRRLHAQA